MADATGSQVALWRTSTIREHVDPSNLIIAIPTHNAEPWKDYLSKEVAG